MTRALLVALVVGVLLGASACAIPTNDAAANEELVDACPDEPDVTWDAFADGFFTSRCQACHAKDAPDRRGAPDDITFDDESAAILLSDRIRDRVIAEPSMPPGGGISEDERALLDVWLRCR